MKNEEYWRPSKFVIRKGRLSFSLDESEVSVASRLATALIARDYESYIQAHCGGKLLDLGCGKVPLYETYRNLVTETICLDWNNNQSGYTHLDYKCDLCLTLPFPDNTFDTIILSDVLEHVPTPDLLWREIARILKPGGKILANTPFYYKIHEAPHDYYRYTRFALHRFVQQNNMELALLEPTGGIPEILTDLAAKLVSGIPYIGKRIAAILQTTTYWIVRTSAGKKLSQKSAAQFPFGYFLVAVKRAG